MNDIISPRLYNRESLDWGLYKVTKFIENRGKTKVPYYLVKFKNSGNEYELPLHQIEADKVVDMKKKKSATKKKNRVKKKEVKQAKYEAKRFVINLGETPRLLALDLSTHSTGIAIFIEGELVRYDYIYQPHSIKWDIKRINYMKVEVMKLIEEYDINCVAMEDIIFKHKIALHVLSKLQGVICDYLFENSIRFALITPIEWKSAYNINRDGYDGENTREQSKLKTVACVNKDFGLSLESEFSDSPSDLKEPCWYDVADAIGVGYIALRDRIK